MDPKKPDPNETTKPDLPTREAPVPAMSPATMAKYEWLLNPGPPETTTPEEYWEAAARFVNACCWDEKESYALCADTSTDACWHPSGGIVCDQCADIKTGMVYQMVLNGGRPIQSSTWLEHAEITVAPNRHVAPYDPQAHPAPPGTINPPEKPEGPAIPERPIGPPITGPIVPPVPDHGLPGAEKPELPAKPEGPIGDEKPEEPIKPEEPPPTAEPKKK